VKLQILPPASQHSRLFCLSLSTSQLILIIIISVRELGTAYKHTFDGQLPMANFLWPTSSISFLHQRTARLTNPVNYSPVVSNVARLNLFAANKETNGSTQTDLMQGFSFNRMLP